MAGCTLASAADQRGISSMDSSLRSVARDPRNVEKIVDQVRKRLYPPVDGFDGLLAGPINSSRRSGWHIEWRLADRAARGRAWPGSRPFAAATLQILIQRRQLVDGRRMRRANSMPTARSSRRYRRPDLDDAKAITPIDLPRKMIGTMTSDRAQAGQSVGDAIRRAAASRTAAGTSLMSSGWPVRTTLTAIEGYSTQRIAAKNLIEERLLLRVWQKCLPERLMRPWGSTTLTTHHLQTTAPSRASRLSMLARPRGRKARPRIGKQA